MRRLRLRTLLAVLVLVTTLPVAAFAGWLISRWSAQQQALIERQNIEQARAILVAVDKEVESTIASLNVLAAIDEIDAPDKADFIRIATRILELHPGWHSVRLIDNSLELVASTSSAQDGSPVLGPGVGSPDHSDRPVGGVESRAGSADRPVDDFHRRTGAPRQPVPLGAGGQSVRAHVQ